MGVKFAMVLSSLDIGSSVEDIRSEVSMERISVETSLRIDIIMFLVVISQITHFGIYI